MPMINEQMMGGQQNMMMQQMQMMARACGFSSAEGSPKRPHVLLVVIIYDRSEMFRVQQQTMMQMMAGTMSGMGNIGMPIPQGQYPQPPYGGRCETESVVSCYVNMLLLQRWKIRTPGR
jgi:hypothetical protein